MSSQTGEMHHDISLPEPARMMFLRTDEDQRVEDLIIVMTSRIQVRAISATSAAQIECNIVGNSTAMEVRTKLNTCCITTIILC